MSGRGRRVLRLAWTVAVIALVIAVTAGWYVLVSSRLSAVVAITAALSFIVLHYVSGVRRAIDRHAPAGYGAYRILFAVIFAAGAVVLYRQASAYQTTQSPPVYPSPPNVQFAAPHVLDPTPTGKPPTKYYYTITVSPHTCADPVADVQVQLYVLPRSQYTYPPQYIGYVYLSLSDDRHPITDIRLPSQGETDRVTYHPAANTNFRAEGEIPHVLPGGGTIISFYVGNWPISPSHPITVDFKAHWVWKRSVGTCYVIIPQTAVKGGSRAMWAQPIVATTRIIAPGTVLLNASSSPPLHPLIPEWGCTLTTTAFPDCSGYAVYAQPNAVQRASDLFFLFAAMLGVCLAIAVELTIQPLCDRERRLRENEPPDDEGQPARG